ncbi:uncharacterized protein EV420DRAFT_1578408 [Desarmillaria tabescens]|uniref:Uncharacterized protein n=1 Tax=Armillaria tabescens TaxID=1929756 RepID=A0AA39MQ44_ARMTA|nr:uncharacterized protein EV420DRAFT_1578408 [Desarmillaria tabescens]KAK0442517.1 hypothetical protein EV420DRAFT_1578408 [Desarmillaria tabescens]
MLGDCMELTQLDGSTRWIPKNIPNIDRTIEPLLRLEVLFPHLRRKFPAGFFGEHDLDFSTKDISDNLSLTLSSMEDTHIRKPMHLASRNEVAMNALADLSFHHPCVWQSLILGENATVFHKLFERHDNPNFTLEMCANLVACLYMSETDVSTSYSCTFADVAAKDFPDHCINTLLSFFAEFDSYKDAMDHRPRLLLAIIQFFVLDSENSPPASLFGTLGQSPGDYSTFISKYRLLEVVLQAVKRDLHDPDNSPSPFLHDGPCKVIVSFITSNLFTGDFGIHPSGIRFEVTRLIWTCYDHALSCMISVLNREPALGISVPLAEWDTKAFFSSIIGIVLQDFNSDDLDRFPSGYQLHYGQGYASPFRAVDFLLGQGFSGGIADAYDAFLEQGVLMHITQKRQLQLWLIEGLQRYITGISEATKKTGKYRDIQSESFLQRHIDNLHQSIVIHGICASIARNRIQSRSILSSLASIAPNHQNWPEIIDTLNPETYDRTPSESDGLKDEICYKKELKETVCILAKCLEAERDGKSGVNWPSKTLSYNNWWRKFHHVCGSQKGKKGLGDFDEDMQPEDKDFERQ